MKPFAKRVVVAVVLAGTTLLTACGGSDAAQQTPEAAAVAPSGLLRVAPVDAAAVIAEQPADLVILDVRTPEEFAEGHVDGAVMLDFYRDDFASRLAELDPDVPYVLYCRSGNRSGQTLEAMEELGFQNVRDVDGGIVAWQNAGLPVVTD